MDNRKKSYGKREWELFMIIEQMSMKYLPSLDYSYRCHSLKRDILRL